MSAPQAPDRQAPAASPDLGPGPAILPAPALAGRQVLVVGTDYAPDESGTAPYTTAIAEHLATGAAAVTVLTGVPRHADGRVAAAYRHGLRTADPSWNAPERPRVIRLRHVGRRSRQAPLRRVLRDLTFLLNAVLSGRQTGADLVVGVTPGAGSAAAAAWLARRRGAPLVTIVQAIQQPRQPRVTPLPAGGWAARFGAALERYALRRSSAVAITSPDYREAVLAAGVDPGRLHLLPTWSRLEPSGLPREAARRELGWEPGRFIAVHAGELDHQQDGATLVEAARLLGEAADAGVDLVLVGGGPQRGALEQQAFGLDHVHFLDAADESTLPLVLAAADVLLIAEAGRGGRSATSGRLADCLAAGRPVVAATADDGLTARELRRAGGVGVRVDPGDVSALTDALLQLAGAGERRAAMGRAAARYARTQLGRAAALRRLDVVVAAALDDVAAGGDR